MDSIGRAAGTTQAYGRPAVAGTSPTGSVASVDTSREDGGITAPQKKERLDASDQIHQSLSGIARRDDPADATSAMERKPADSHEAREARDDYKMAWKDQANARQHAMDDMQQVGAGEGRHKTPSGEEVTFTRNEQGRTVGTYSGTEGGKPYSRTVEFDPQDQAYVRTTFDQDGSHSEVLKDGNRITTRFQGKLLDQDYTNSKSFEVDGQGLTVRQDDNGSVRQVTAHQDGSATVRTERKDLDGTRKVEEHAVPLDEKRAQREKIVREGTYAVDKDGHRVAATEEQISQITDGLEGYPPEVLKKLHDGGLRYAVVDPKHPPKGGYPGGNAEWPKDAQDKNPAGGYYNSVDNVVVLRNDGTIEPRVPTHEVGHAVDHYQAQKKGGFMGIGGTKGFSSEDDKTLQGIYHDYQKRVAADPKQKWTRLRHHESAGILRRGI